MRLTRVLRGEYFGHIEDKVRGYVTYQLSPFEQRAFAGVTENIGNTIGRIVSLLLIVPYFGVSYALYNLVEDKHHQYSKKNPEDYLEFYDTEGITFKKRTKPLKKKWPKD